MARPRVPLGPMDDPFIQIDRGRAADRLRLTDRGAEYGGIELPASDTRVFDAVEAEIVAEINQHYARAQIDASNQIRSYESRVADLTLLAELASIRAQGRVAVSDFGAEVVIANNELANSRDAISDSYADLHAFRQQHRLNRPARDAQPVVVIVGGILFAWLLETVANTAFLRVNDDMGLLGGFIAAAIVAAINIFVSAAFGRLVWPRVWSVDPFNRNAARMGVVLWLAMLLVWSIAAAHYRDAKAAGAAVPEVEALHLLHGQTLTFDSLYSWGLLVIGILFAILSALGGFRMDDPCPGYGDVSRAHNDRCEAYADAIANVTEQLRTIRDDAIGDAEEVRSQLAVEFRERDRIISASNAFRRRYEEFSLQLEQTGNALLEIYRAANRKARASAVPPPFNVYWEMARTPLPPALDIAAPDVEIKAAERELDTAIASISDAFDKAVHSFEPLDVLKRRLANG